MTEHLLRTAILWGMVPDKSATIALHEVGLPAESQRVSRFGAALVVAWIVGVTCLAWAHSVPGLNTPTWLLGAVLTGAGAVGWLVQVAQAVAARKWSPGLLLVPAVVASLMLLLSVNAPLQARWALSRSAFDAVAREAPPARLHCGPLTDEDWTLRDGFPARIGSYSISAAEQVPCGLFLFEASGSPLIDNAGFAYLPGGPEDSLTTGSLERAEFHPLGGGWYAWTVSW